MLRTGMHDAPVPPRQRRRLRRMWTVLWRLGTGLAIASLGAALVWGGLLGYRLVCDAPYFRLRTIHIEGNEILTQSDVHYLLALAPHVTIWRLDLSRIGTRLERHPYVKAVAVRRLFPDTLTVSIEERVPYLTVLAGQQHMVLDVEGVVLGPFDEQLHKQLPQFTLTEKRALTPGMRLQQQDVEQALGLVRAYRLSPAASGTRLVALTVEATGMSVVRVEPYTFPIRLNPGELEAQLGRLPAVLQVIQEQNLAVQLVDISYRKRVIVTLKEREERQL